MLAFVRFICLLTLLLFVAPVLPAQSVTGDIRPMLKSLTQAQKLQVLGYLRHLGANLDNEIQHTYEQVGRSAQVKSVQFIDILKKSQNENALTTVNWNRDTLFFNDLIAGTPLLDSFVVTNTGKAPYLITGTKTTCDCTVLQLPEHPVMPGESAVLRIEFKSNGKLGITTPAILIFDNSFPNKRNILYLKGNVVPSKKLRKYPWD